MVLYIFCVAVLNLALGFAAAVQLARRHRAVLAAASEGRSWDRAPGPVRTRSEHAEDAPPEAAQPGPPTTDDAADELGAEEVAPDVPPEVKEDASALQEAPESLPEEPVPEVSPEGPAPEASLEGPSPESSLDLRTSQASEVLRGLEGVNTSEVCAAQRESETRSPDGPGPEALGRVSGTESDGAPDGSEAQLEAARGGSPEAGDQVGANPSSSDAALESALERALGQWRAEASRYFEQLSRARDDMEKQQASPAAEEIKGCLSTLRAAGEEYLTTARPARQAFSRLSDLRPDMAPLRDDLHAIAGKEEALIEVAHQAVESFDERADLSAGCRQMAQHAGRLIQVNRQVQEALSAAAAGRGSGSQAQHPGREAPPETPREPLIDEATRETLAEWWEEKRGQTRHLSVVMIDVDDFGGMEQRHGPRLGEAVLHAISKLLEAEYRGEGLALRMTGPRFACLCYETDLGAAVESAERLRQMLGAARFVRRQTEIRISVSCGVTEATSEDTPDTLLSRAEAALVQCGRYGKNRTFSHDGHFPMPVTPPRLDVTPKHVEI